VRLYHLGWLLERGVWYPRWVPEMFLGYGYPLFNYYAPAFYYLAWGLGVLLRLDVWDSYRAAGVAAALLGAGGVYALATAVWRRASLGVLSALAVLYGPYVFQTNLFKRGDIPEALGLALIPWLLLALWRLWLAPAGRRRLAWTAGAAAVGAAEILTHNLTALLAAAVAAVWVAYLGIVRPARTAWLHVLVAGALAVGLTGFFWLPAIGEAGLVHLNELWGQEGLDYRGWLVDPNGQTPRQRSAHNPQTRTGLIDLHLHYPHQLIAPPKISLAQAGLGGLALAGLAAALLASARRSRPERGTEPADPPSAVQAPASPPRGGPALQQLHVASPSTAHVPLLLAAGACWFLTFTASTAVWEAVPGLSLLQFPWRLLGPLGICLAVAGVGGIVPVLEAFERRRRGRILGWGVVGLAAGLVLFNSIGARDLQLREVADRRIDGHAVVADEIRDSVGAGTTSNREFLPRDVQIATYTAGRPRGRNVYERLYPEAEWLGGLVHPMAGDVRLLGWRSGPLSLSVRVANDGSETGRIGLRQLRFAGWRAWLDGVRVPIGVAPFSAEQQASLGFMVVDVPPGEHTLDAAFGASRLRLIGLVVTLASIVGVAGGGVWLAVRWWARAGGGAVRPSAAPGRGRWGLVVAGALLAAGAVRLGGAPLAAAPVPARALDHVETAPPLGRFGSALLVNVAGAVRTGRAHVESPSGAAPGTFVDVRYLTVADVDPDRGPAGVSRREWLYVHPPSQVSTDVDLPPGRQVWFQAGLALDPAMWQAPTGDGVRFQALVSRLAAPGQSGPSAVVLDRVINPRARVEHRRWVPVEVDLSPWAGAAIRLTLRTLPHEDLSYDWAGWGTPIVAVRDFARSRPPATYD
jgi:hypothetical protein